MIIQECLLFKVSDVILLFCRPAQQNCTNVQVNETRVHMSEIGEITVTFSYPPFDRNKSIHLKEYEV